MTISNTTVNLIRQAKIKGYSLNDIAKWFCISKSTVSLYCRDLYDDPRRIYQTQEEARAMGFLHSTIIFYPCPECGKQIRKERKLCKNCDTIRRQIGNPICNKCGKKARKDGYTRNGKRAYECYYCGHHFLLYYDKRTHKIRETVISKQEFEAIFANNTGIKVIDDLTRKLPLFYRSDVRQEVALRCFELHVDVNDVDVIADMVQQVSHQYRNEEVRRRYGERSLFSKVSNEGNIELWQTIVDPSADIEVELENQEIIRRHELEIIKVGDN